MGQAATAVLCVLQEFASALPRKLTRHGANDRTQNAHRICNRSGLCGLCGLWNQQLADNRARGMVQLRPWPPFIFCLYVTLQRSRLGKDNRLALYRTKTGNPVTVLLPPPIADELRSVPPGLDAHPDYFFWSGKGKKNKAASTWQKTLRRLWKLVKPALDLEDRDGKRIQPKSHMFRNTFAVELLKKHVSVDHVAMLLADDPDTVKHIIPGCQSFRICWRKK